MSSLMSSLGVDRLSEAEQLQLVQEILTRLDANQESAVVTVAQRRELDRRLAILDAAPDATSPWSEVEARVLATLER